MSDWLLHTDAGLLVRMSAGVAVFGVLALIDFRKHGRAANRWREYMVLLTAVGAALAYGAINDQVTVTISPEYFLYGKELAKITGDPPSSEAALRWEAAKVGFKATWSAGLIFGVALLLANNPSRALPRVTNLQLVRLLPMMLLITACCGVAGGLAGYSGLLTRFSSDFAEMVADNLWRPNRFMATWGVHLGGYVGGLVATVVAVVLVRRKRAMQARRMA